MFSALGRDRDLMSAGKNARQSCLFPIIKRTATRVGASRRVQADRIFGSHRGTSHPPALWSSNQISEVFPRESCARIFHPYHTVPRPDARLEQLARNSRRVLGPCRNVRTRETSPIISRNGTEDVLNDQRSTHHPAQASYPSARRTDRRRQQDMPARRRFALTPPHLTSLRARGEARR